MKSGHFIIFYLAFYLMNQDKEGLIPG